MTEPRARAFRILSLDGGGIRGAFIAGFLAGVEERLGIHLAKHFDLIAGTSTGAIIAAALAVGEPASRIEEFYKKYGQKIFSGRPPKERGRLTWIRAKAAHFCFDRILRKFNLDYENLFQPKYAPCPLREALTEVFGNRTLESATTRLVIPAVDLTGGQTIVFKTPHLPEMIRDRYLQIVDVLMATTAAPTYFPHATIGVGSAYVDGGLWANNPSIVAIVEALRIRDEATRKDIDKTFDRDSIEMLSVGTGKASYFAKPPADGGGIYWWAPHLVNIPSVAQSQGINFQASFLLGNRLHRIDYDLPDGRWSLDNTEMLDQMIEIGRRRTIERLSELKPFFFEGYSECPYFPFPDTSRDQRGG